MPRSYLFIHQNFPGQFVHVAAELARQGHRVVALGIKGRPVPGVQYVRYRLPADPPQGGPELSREFDNQVVRATACARAMLALKERGFTPDVIVGHPGWGETLYCKDVWPSARLVIFAEFFYSSEGSDFGFDPEFANDTPWTRARLRMKNSVHLQAFHAADAGYSPTRWQHSRIPAEYRDKFQVIFDGIDTGVVAPDKTAFVTLARQKLKLTQADEVVTFVNRNLEPYRGFHVFMRALPELLEARPKAHCIIVGKDEVSYGAPPKDGGTWREKLLKEVGSKLPPGRVHFVGSLSYENYLRMLQVSSCHVYLTYPFVLSWSCLEAMACEAPIVASRTAPVQEVVEDGVTGRLFDFFDAPGLAGQAAAALENRAQARERARAARRMVVERYDLRTRCLPQQLATVA